MPLNQTVFGAVLARPRDPHSVEWDPMAPRIADQEARLFVRAQWWPQCWTNALWPPVDDPPADYRSGHATCSPQVSTSGDFITSPAPGGQSQTCTAEHENYADPDHSCHPGAGLRQRRHVPWRRGRRRNVDSDLHR